MAIIGLKQIVKCYQVYIRGKEGNHFTLGKEIGLNDLVEDSKVDGPMNGCKICLALFDLITNKRPCLVL